MSGGMKAGLALISRLLGRAYVTILQAREEIESQVADTYRQAGIDVDSAAGHVGTLSDKEVRSLLLEAAENVRYLGLPGKQALSIRDGTTFGLGRSKE